MSIDPYGSPEKPSTIARITSALGTTNVVLAGIFVVIGVGALVVAAVTAEPVTTTVGVAAIVMGAVRLVPALLRR